MRSKKMGSVRKGLSLMEVLVVIAIIAVLIGLMLPAIQNAREAARRTQSENNLKQLSLAALNFQTQRGYFPPGAMNESFSGGPVSDLPKDGSVRHGWGIFLLPMLEQNALYERYNFQRDFASAENQSAVSQPLAVFTSPVAPNGLRRGSEQGGRMLAVSDYHPPRGVSELLIGDHHDDDDHGAIPIVPKADYRGIFGRNSVTRPAEVSDGMSHTILLVESAGGPDLYRLGRPIPGATVKGYSAYSFESPFLVHGTCDLGGHFPGAYWNVTNLGGDDGEAHGFHSGVVLAAFADGGVRKLSKSLDIRIYVKLVGMKDGSTVSSSDY